MVVEVLAGAESLAVDQGESQVPRAAAGTADVGDDGDLYLSLESPLLCIYGPKVGGAWPSLQYSGFIPPGEPYPASPRSISGGTCMDHVPPHTVSGSGTTSGGGTLLVRLSPGFTELPSCQVGPLERNTNGDYVFVSGHFDLNAREDGYFVWLEIRTKTIVPGQLPVPYGPWNVTYSCTGR